MLKYTAFVSLLPIALLAALWTGGDTPSPDQSYVVDREVFAANLEERCAGRKRLAEVMYPLLDELGQGKVTLRAASERIAAAAVCHHPEYLSHAAAVEGGASPLENVARNCIRHFEVAIGDPLAPHDQASQASTVVIELRKQLAEMFALRVVEE